MKSNLELVEETDSVPYSQALSADSVGLDVPDGTFALIWQDEKGTYPIGYILDRVVRKLVEAPENVRGPIDLDEVNRTVSLFRLPTEPERTATAAALASYWRDCQTFKLLRGWRDELLPVYGRNGELLLSIERVAIGLFGAMRYGVHMTAFVADPAAPHGILIWVPKRASNKSTFPGMLDNTVAGGLTTNEEPIECIVREADEEASLPQDLVRNSAREAGTITYAYITEEKHVGESGFIYPECQWIFDLHLSRSIVPQPKDGEVEEFSLCDVTQVMNFLAEGKFKNNCAVVMLDFLIRRGIITEDNEPNLNIICQRIHRTLPFPGPHQEDWPRS